MFVGFPSHHIAYEGHDQDVKMGHTYKECLLKIIDYLGNDNMFPLEKYLSNSNSLKFIANEDERVLERVVIKAMEAYNKAEGPASGCRWHLEVYEYDNNTLESIRRIPIDIR